MGDIDIACGDLVVSIRVLLQAAAAELCFALLCFALTYTAHYRYAGCTYLPYLSGSC